MPNKRRFSLPFVEMIHENLSTIMCFAFSQQPLVAMFEETFRGRWASLHRALFEISEERANRACLELALSLRMFDDEQGISDYLASIDSVPNCGKLIMKDGTEKPLAFRDVANKVIHASSLEWKVSKDAYPVFICHTQDAEKWLRAEIHLVALAGVCGSFGW